MAPEAEFEWHTGESQMHKLLRVPEDENPTTPYLAPYAGHILMRCPILAVGTLDTERRPWTSLWGGEPGFTRAIGQSIIGVKAHVDRKYDPVIQALLGDKADGEVVREDGPGRMISALGIDLETRSRVKLYGKMAAGALATTEGDAGEAQLVVKIEQSLGNCPKYLNKKHITPRLPTPKLISNSLPLPQIAVNLLAKADNFYISSSNHNSDMDTNHRGGPPGFVRLEANSAKSCSIIYPEYSGNRLYQTLGNLITTPLAGLVFPDYETGDVLYITGTTEILVREMAAAVMPRINVVVRIRITSARYVASGLSFRGDVLDYNPYNPPVRFLQNEATHSLPSVAKKITARLLDKKIITPNIGRFSFSIDDPDKSKPKINSSLTTWIPGQYVAFDFSEELDIGYSHMRDDDPKSLNDDFLRTFTVSSNPFFSSSSRLQKPDFSTFEITIRRLGPVTSFLFKQNVRSRLSVPLRGFGGEFIFHQGQYEDRRFSSKEPKEPKASKEVIGVVAGGIGITPLLAQVPDLDLSRMQLFWTLRAEDLNLVLDTFERFPGLVASTRLFITGLSGKNNEVKGGAVYGEVRKMLERLENMGVSIQKRRVERGDLIVEGSEMHSVEGQQQEKDVEKTQIKTWYVCTGLGLKKMVEEWLHGRTVISEKFDY